MTLEEALQLTFENRMKGSDTEFSALELSRHRSLKRFYTEAAELWQQSNLERIKELEEREVKMNAELSKLDKMYKEFKGAYELYKHKFENSEKRIKELEDGLKDVLAQTETKEPHEWNAWVNIYAIKELLK